MRGAKGVKTCGTRRRKNSTSDGNTGQPMQTPEHPHKKPACSIAMSFHEIVLCSTGRPGEACQQAPLPPYPQCCNSNASPVFLLGITQTQTPRSKPSQTTAPTGYIISSLFPLSVHSTLENQAPHPSTTAPTTNTPFPTPLLLSLFAFITPEHQHAIHQLACTYASSVPKLGISASQFPAAASLARSSLYTQMSVIAASSCGMH